MSERSENPARSGSPRRAASNPSSDNRLVVIAVVLGVVAVILQMIYVQWVKSEAGTDEFNVYRFEVGLERGEELRRDDLETVPVPMRFQDSFQGAINADELENYLGTRLQQPAQQSALLTYDLFQQTVGRTLALEVDPDKVLVSIPVRGERLQGLKPGDRVHLAAPIPHRGSARPKVMPVMSDVRVMAVGEQTLVDEEEGFENRQRRFTHISIQMPSEQWLQLEQIELLATGPFYVALRSPAKNPETLWGGGESPLPEQGTINTELLRMIEADRG